MKRISLLFTLWAAVLAVAAQQISFQALPPRGAVRTGEKFALSFRLNNASASAPRQPQIDGCTFIFGPSTSSRSSYSVVNGSVTQSSSVDYTFTYRADKEGTYNVGAVSVNVDGKTYTSKPFTITVVKGQQQPSSQQPSQGGYGQPSRQAPVDIDDISTQSSGRAVGANDVFVRIILSKPSAYEQEAIACTIKLYTKYQISSFMPTLQPSFDGFLAQEVDVQPALNEVESLNGQNYMTAVLKRVILYPQHPGKLTINSGNYNITVVQYERINMGLMSVSNPVEKQIQVSSNKASVDVRPLPEPRPADFSGAVGTFSVDTRLVGNNFRTGDAASLIYTINGTGNIKYLKEPKIDFPSEFELYEPQSEIDTRVSGSNVTGTVTVNYTFVPQAVGTFKIGGDRFVYFNPASAQYVTLTTPPYDIKVNQGNASATSRQQIESKNVDILHIHPNAAAGASKDHTPMVERGWYWLLYLAALCVLGAVVYANRRRMRMDADVVGTRMARANKEARRRLKAAAAFKAKGDTEHFYEAVLQAMWGLLSDKLNMPASQLSRDNASDELARYGASDEVRQSLVKLLDECEMARYAPVSAAGHLDDVYAEAARLIDKISSIRKK